MSIFTKVLRAGEGRKLKRLAEVVPLINELEQEIALLSDEELASKTVEFRSRLEGDEDLDDILVEAFAVVREAAKRTIGQRHYDVQLMGGMALHFGGIAEMKTGEGKTLVSTLPVYLNALLGEGVHVVTVNDYLAQRDSEWMGRVYRALGLTVGRVGAHDLSPEGKRAAYNCDITYGTNTEFGFDYLRDNMATSLSDRVQRSHYYAIVDEVDSILIDEARTPLIISGPSDEGAQLYYQFAGIVRSLKKDLHYEVDEEKKTVIPTEEGISKVEQLTGIENLYDISAMIQLHQLNQALRAKELYHRDRDYIVEKGEVKIVDEFTGRTLEGRRWSEGLHQAVEAKERVRIKEENHTWATVTLQNYFRMYEKLSGMTGTAETEAAEFASTYGLQVIPIPTNLPIKRVDLGDYIFKTEAAKFEAIADDIEQRYSKGQPVLVGTASVHKSEKLSQILAKRSIPHNVLNAKLHAQEAQIVAQAGRIGAITVATNMAGRGVDILLGGNPESLTTKRATEEGVDLATEEGLALMAKISEEIKAKCAQDAEVIRGLGGLYVLGTERHESRRIDNQLRGRSGRQGDPGESRFYLSLEDDLMRLFSGAAVGWLMDKTFPDDMPIEAKMVSKAIEKAQTTVEAKNAEIRKDVLKYDEALDEQRKVIYQRRLQVIEGEDLSVKTLEVLQSVIYSLVDEYCVGEYVEDWDLEGLVSAMKRFWATKFLIEDLAQAITKEQLIESIHQEALESYQQKVSRLPGGPDMARQIEREVMLLVIDQKWREHLADMDYLREGINLRAMGQQDPLVAWQREAYAMFGNLMARIDEEYLQYVMQVEVVEPEPVQIDLSQASYFGATDPGDISLLYAADPVPSGVVAGAGESPLPDNVIQFGEQASMPIRKSESEKIGRNDPCHCGSGLKFKNCHGR